MLDALKLMLKSRAFVISALALGISAVSLQAAARWAQLRFRKEPAPILKPLKYLDREALAPYQFLRTVHLSSEEEESLGTHEYVNWIMEDTSVPEDDRARLVHLFITYYTGSLDQVPHVPDLCYLGAGYTPAGAGTHSFLIPELAEYGYGTRVPFRALTFVKPGDIEDSRPVVVYTFGVNSIIEAERNRVRKAMASIRQRYAYFSKVEVSYGFGQRYPKRDRAVEEAKKLLAKVLPLLVREHWPDLSSMKAPPEQDARANHAAG